MSVELVAPAMAVAPRNHCNVGVGEPEAAAVNWTVPPAATVREVGWVEMVGAVLSAAAMLMVYENDVLSPVPLTFSHARREIVNWPAVVGVPSSWIVEPLTIPLATPAAELPSGLKVSPGGTLPPTVNEAGGVCAPETV